ncbi:MAG: hypothetical protein J6033_04475 [Lachnospiraceae bacterium]|nr:hypothetical protein [Lachnospiraceae bacterium]
MKMRRILMFCLCSLMVVLSTGCGAIDGDYPDLTPKEEQMVSDYAAILLLQYDASTRSRLVAEDEVLMDNAKRRTANINSITLKAKEELNSKMEELKREEEEKNNSKSDDSSDGSKSGNAEAVSYSLEEVFKLPDGVSLVYSGSNVMESFDGGEDDPLSVVADKGSLLLMAGFTLTNNSGADVDLDFLHETISARLFLNGRGAKGFLPTFFDNDLMNYKNTLENGSSVNLYLIFQEDMNELNEISDLRIVLKNESKSHTISE